PRASKRPARCLRCWSCCSWLTNRLRHVTEDALLRGPSAFRDHPCPEGLRSPEVVLSIGVITTTPSAARLGSSPRLPVLWLYERSLQYSSVFPLGPPSLGPPSPRGPLLRGLVAAPPSSLLRPQLPVSAPPPDFPVVRYTGGFAMRVRLGWAP